MTTPVRYVTFTLLLSLPIKMLSSQEGNQWVDGLYDDDSDDDGSSEIKCIIKCVVLSAGLMLPTAQLTTNTTICHRDLRGVLCCKLENSSGAGR